MHIKNELQYLYTVNLWHTKLCKQNAMGKKLIKSLSCKFPQVGKLLKAVKFRSHYGNKNYEMFHDRRMQEIKIYI